MLCIHCRVCVTLDVLVQCTSFNPACTKQQAVLTPHCSAVLLPLLLLALHHGQ
jgi:hypothetical protein